MKLTANISLAEFEKSQVASRLGLNNTVPEDYIINAQALAENVLQPVRDKFGPVIITSGYRCPELNAAIKGSWNSQHTYAQAADFEVLGADNLIVANFIREHCRFDQLILEYYVSGRPTSGWIHCSMVLNERNRQQTLTASRVDGTVKYMPGLVTD